MSEPDHHQAAPPWPAEVDAFIAAAADGVDRTVRAIGRGAGIAADAERWSAGPATVYGFDSPSSAGLQLFEGFLDRLSQVAPFEVSPLAGRVDRWLVTRSPTGRPADKPELHADPDDLVVAVGRGLRALHELPVTVLDGATGGWSAIAELCRRAVDAGAVSGQRLPRPYNRYQPAELLKLWTEGRPARAADGGGEDAPVLCHGFATAERFIVHGPEFAGFDRMETPIVADRHFDLAVVHQSVQHHFGPEAVFRLYDAYGADPDVVLLDHYVLASHLLGRAPLLDSITADAGD